jgi:3-oxoacyl-[acyl-carrier-protein] synthase-1
MKPAAVITSHAAVTCLGENSDATWTALCLGEIGLREEPLGGGYVCPVGRIKGGRTTFNGLLRRTLTNAPSSWRWTASDTVWIVCSAKGNIEALAGRQGPYGLADCANILANEMGLKRAPICFSTACTSSLAGLAHGVRLLRSGRAGRVAVSGCDLASKFVLTGFNRIHAVSPVRCRPYDAERKGINLASAAATVFLEWRSPQPGEIYVAGEATSNDGFHISRPDPEGRGLKDCIRRSLSGTVPDFICGHGTATILNDDTESVAIAGSGLATVPVFSVKGQLGHTLGTCGVLETIITIRCLKENVILPSVGYDAPGTTAAINVLREPIQMPISSGLNLAVGFGGGNAAILLYKAGPASMLTYNDDIGTRLSS